MLDMKAGSISLLNVEAGSGGDVVSLMNVETGSGGGVVSLLNVEAGSRGGVISLLNVEDGSGGCSVVLLLAIAKSVHGFKQQLTADCTCVGRCQRGIHK